MSRYIDADEAKKDADDEIFNMLSENCKYYHVGFDEDRVACATCRHKDNIPAGHSWGICDKDHCPIYAMKDGGKNEKRVST